MILLTILCASILTLLHIGVAGGQSCPAGSYIPSRGSCSQCFEGTFSSAAGALGRDLCRPCPSGTFARRPGSASCTPCARGSNSTESARRCASCPKGSRLTPNGGCKKCQIGQYNDIANVAECKQCPNGYTSPVGADSISQCVPCPPGTQGSRCSACPRDFFNDGLRPACERCPAGFTTFGFQRASSCSYCPPGTYGAFFCANCPAGQLTLGVGDLCRKGRSDCPPGSLETRNGACLFCGAGARIDMKKGRCEECPFGFASAGGTTKKCTRCRFGVDRFDKSKCLCKAGFAPNAAGRCEKCKAGEHTIFRGRCSACFEGFFAPRKGTPLCFPCPSGTIAAERGSTRCMRCPPGLIVSARRNKCVSPITNCAPDERRRIGASPFQSWRFFSDCTKKTCPPGTFRRSDDFCASCRTSTFYSPTSNSCERCPPGTVSSGGIDRTCERCPAGQRVGPGFLKCVRDCPAGTVFEDEDDGIGKCIDCLPGTTSGPNANRCSSCPAGTFSSSSGSSMCRPCPRGTLSYVNFATRCVRDIPFTSPRPTPSPSKTPDPMSAAALCNTPCRKKKEVVKCETVVSGRCIVTVLSRTCSMGRTVLCSILVENRNAVCAAISACP